MGASTQNNTGGTSAKDGTTVRALSAVDARALTFAEVAARSPRVASLREAVLSALNDESVWTKVESYLWGSPTGDRNFDHAHVVLEIRRWDREDNKRRIEAMGVNDITIWRVTNRVLKKFYVLNGGHIVGVRAAEGLSDDDEDGEGGATE